MSTEVKILRDYFLQMRQTAELGLAKCEAMEPAPAPVEQLVNMTIQQYCEHANVSVMTVRRWIKAGLPHLRRGSVIRIPVAEADTWNVAGHLRQSGALIARKG